jgi:hypothetical protein
VTSTDHSPELLAKLEKLQAENASLRARARKQRSKPAARPARPAPAVEKQEPAPAEFEGLSETDCCDGCVAATVKAVQAQTRMNILDMMHPRHPSPNKLSETVMESDAEWLKRNPSLREEWVELTNQVLGHCVIQGGPGCAHPCKGGLSPSSKRDPFAVQRFSRAKRLLKLGQLK